MAKKIRPISRTVRIEAEINRLAGKVLAHSQIKYFRLERECGPFRRYVFLPNAVNPDRTKAILENGVLTIVFKKYRRKKQGEVVLKIKKPDEK